jgi:hypothetical protein
MIYYSHNRLINQLINQIHRKGNIEMTSIRKIFEVIMTATVGSMESLERPKKRDDLYE